MNHKALFLASLLVVYAPAVRAQTTVNPSGWQDRDGLTVASAQEVTVAPTKLRLFSTITARDKDARRAVTRLAEKKTAVKDKLQSLGFKPNAIKVSPSRILEWTDSTAQVWWSDSEYAMRVPEDQPTECTAYAAVEAEWEIKGKTSDEVILMPVDLIERIRKAAVFEPVHKNATKEDECASGTYVIFVGEVSEEAGTKALKRAYEEASAQATKLAATTHRTLGKLMSMSPRIDSAWIWSWEPELSNRYRVGNSKNGLIPHPMSQFTHAPAEVIGSDPTDLHRKYVMELRFEVK
jgi:hypothetical protein